MFLYQMRSMTKKRIRIISSLDFFTFLFCRLFQFAIHRKVIHYVHKEDRRGSGMLIFCRILSVMSFLSENNGLKPTK